MARRILVSLLSAAAVLLAVSALIPTTAAAARAEICTKASLGEPTTTLYSSNTCLTTSKAGEYHRLVASGEIPIRLIPSFQQHLSVITAGIEVELTCTELTNSAGTLENVETPGVPIVLGNKLKLVYDECVVNKPAGRNCKVVDPFETTALQTVAQDGEGITEVRFEPESGTSLGSFTIEGCTIAMLNHLYGMSGEFTGLVPVGEQSAIEFTKAIKASGLFKIAGNTAGYIGKTTAEKGEKVGGETILIGLF